MDHYSMAECFAKAYNNQNPAYFELVLADDFEYTSFWVFDTLKRPDNFIAYFSEKLERIKKNDGELRAEIFKWPLPKFADQEKDSPNIVLYQKLVANPPEGSFKVFLVNENGDMEEFIAVAILLTFSNNKISKACVFPIDTLGYIERTGSFPT